MAVSSLEREESPAAKNGQLCEIETLPAESHSTTRDHGQTPILAGSSTNAGYDDLESVNLKTTVQFNEVRKLNTGE